MSNARLETMVRNLPKVRRTEELARRTPRVLAPENSLLLAALVLARGDASVQISRASGPMDISLEVLGQLAEMLVRKPVLTEWTPVLNELASRAQPQNQNWEIGPASKPILRAVRRPLKGALFQPGLAPGYVRWFLLSGHAALRSSIFCAAEAQHPIPRIRGEVADLFREVAETEILPKFDEMRAKAHMPPRKTKASLGAALPA